MNGTATHEPSFHLLDEPWILCLTQDGRATLSIRQVFDGSHTPLKIVGDSPTQDYAILRLLLAIFWRAQQQDLAARELKRKAREAFSWSDWFQTALNTTRSGSPDEVVLAYLESHRDRFDLLHPQTPFMQVADLHTDSGKQLEISRIVPEAEHSYFTMRTAEGRKSLSFAEAARWLIHTQAYDYSGIKPGAVGDPRAKGNKGYPIGTGWTGMTGGTVVQGSTLRETLVLNSTQAVLSAQGSEDLPVWERPADTAAPRSSETPRGAVDLATWQSRRIRLFHNDSSVTGVLVTNGDRIPDAGKNIFDDPMTPYRYSPNQTKKGVLAYYPLPYATDRTMWRALDALIVEEGDAGFTEKTRAPIRPATLSHLAQLASEGIIDGVLDVSLVSMGYGPQSSSVATTTKAEIGLPLAILRSEKLNAELRLDVRNAAQATAQAATSLGWFAGQLHVAAGGDYEFGRDAADRLYTQLEPEFIAWIRGIGTGDADEYATTWQLTVHRRVFQLADELVRGAGPKALIGRTEGADDAGSAGRIVSAGTLYQQLKHKIAKDLPLTVADLAPEERSTR
ncbi:type I-E CRISPR-associated protein Cse1/CasA [Corynebacterium sp.]|uniref:type I-E CRISPR-associated protein Cse1/CasA n=1 Tax=Corynebacterium sp. TaxID=1720 RepID=UPI002A90FF28|nr:type I-E CRISPR-associated protein Cse1/CasA [Corynebacterium sp.]MDY5786514.1 type I-E CRISPR-associated protein Cse1/CasA [Corynebacterium sp.]